MGCSHNPKKGQVKEKRESRIKRCGFGNKVCYSRYKEASTACNQVSARDDVKMEIYRCEICNKYHLTTIGKKYMLNDNLKRLNELLAQGNLG